MSATPSSMHSWFQRPRSCSASGISAPSGAGPGGTPRVGEQHEREETGDLAVVGKEPSDFARQANGFLREVRALQLGARTSRCSPR